MSDVLTVKCPICRRAVAWLPENAYRPFCSERCRLVDLGEWASENRAVPAPTNWDEEN